MIRPIRINDKVECTLTGRRGEVKNQYRNAAGNVTHVSVTWDNGVVSFVEVSILVPIKELLWD